jgi:hypothetical protein
MSRSTPPQNDRDPVDALLRIQGCPYPAGSSESVAWLRGFHACGEQVSTMVNDRVAPFGRGLQ